MSSHSHSYALPAGAMPAQRFQIQAEEREKFVGGEKEPEATLQVLERGPQGPLAQALRRDAAELTRGEIATVERMLRQLEDQRIGFSGEEGPKTLITNLEHDTILRTHLIKLRNKLNVLEWRAFATKKSFWNLDPVVVDRLLDIQRETATSTGALSALGASLSLSILFSGTRGDLWPFFVAWWLFMIAFAVTSALATSSAASNIAASTDLLETDGTMGSDPALMAPTRRNWFLQRVSILLVFITLTSVVGGFAALCAGAAAFSVTNELHGESPAISGGPDLGPNGFQLAPRLVTYLVIGFFGSFMCGAYLYRLRLHVHASSYGRSFFSEE